MIGNNSPNKSGRELEERYREYENIKIIITKGNLGFARGNNVGYEYAKSQGADFIIQVNNDTLFEDKNFVKTMLQLYEKEKYAVLGPDVICVKDGCHQNPLRRFKITKRSVIWKIIKNSVGNVLADINLDNIIKKELKYQPKWEKAINITLSKEFVLQGCCYIFSPFYIKEFDGMFDGTFMYYEEYILDYLCRKKQLKIIYSPELSVKHLRKAATTSVIENGKDKRKFKYKNSVESLKSFYKRCL